MSRREQILSAALGILDEEGVEAVSVRAVAAKAGIGASTLRHYFPTHRSLLDALATHFTNTALSNCNIEDESIPATERLTECLMQFLPPNSDSLSILEGLITSYSTAFDKGTLIGSKTLQQLMETSENQIAEWLKILQSQDVQLAGSPEQLANFIVIFLNGLTLDLICYATEHPFQRQRESINHLVGTLITSDDSD